MYDIYDMERALPGRLIAGPTPPPVVEPVRTSVIIRRAVSATQMRFGNAAFSNTGPLNFTTADLNTVEWITGLVAGQTYLITVSWSFQFLPISKEPLPIIINSGTPVNTFLDSNGSTYSSYNHSAWSSNYANGSYITTLKPAGTPPRISLGLVNASNFPSPAEYSVTFTITPINF